MENEKLDAAIERLEEMGMGDPHAAAMAATLAATEDAVEATLKRRVLRQGEILDRLMDNVLAWRLGEVANAAVRDPAGDLIDRGLVLRRLLEEAGFGLVLLRKVPR